jgi:uncharacterized protein
MSVERPLVAVLCRSPHAPDCKTRLAAAVGRERAVRLYRACLVGVLRKVVALPVTVRAAVADAPAEVVELCREVAPEAEVAEQRGATFAERQRHEIARGLADGHELVALVASDLPFLDARAVSWAIAAAQAGAVAVVPSPDGGYSVLASSRDLPELAEVPMSRGDTGDMLVTALRAAGRTVRIAEFEVADLDDERDLVATGSEVRLR